MISSFGPDTRIGLVGLGIMGVPLAQRLAARGHEVVAWNLEPERYALVKESGVAWAASPAAVARRFGLVLLCVLGDEAVENCCFGEHGFAAAGGARIWSTCRRPRRRRRSRWPRGSRRPAWTGSTRRCRAARSPRATAR